MESEDQPESIGALWAMVSKQQERAEEQARAQDARIAEQQADIALLKAELRWQRPEMAASGPELEGGQMGRGLSRAGLLKAAAAGLAGVAGAGALGLGGAETALASSTDTNFTATGNGGGGAGFTAYSTANFYEGANLFGSAHGVYGNTPSGTGVFGNSSGGYGGQFYGGLAPLRLYPGASANAPTSGSHLVGEFYVGSGTFYICTASGTPGTWKQLATTDLGLQSFSSPQRVFNFSMTNGQVCNPVSVTWVGVPAGARSAYCAVQAIPTSAGPLTLFPAGASDPGFANWTAVQPNVLNLSYMLVPLSSAGQFQIHSYINGPVYVDVWGYLM